MMAIVCCCLYTVLKAFHWISIVFKWKTIISFSISGLNVHKNFVLLITSSFPIRQFRCQHESNELFEEGECENFQKR